MEFFDSKKMLLVLINGAPATGKTSSIAELVNIFQTQKQLIVFILRVIK